MSPHISLCGLFGLYYGLKLTFYIGLRYEQSLLVYLCYANI